MFFKKAVKEAIKEMQVELFGSDTASKSSISPTTTKEQDRLIRLEKKFDALCQHLGVWVENNYKEYNVREMKTGVGLGSPNTLSR